MTSLLGFLFALSVAISPLTQTSRLLSPTGRIPVTHMLAQDSGSVSFTIENETTANLGSVTITMTDNSYITIGVSGMGIFSGDISKSPSQSTMLSQTFAFDTQKWIVFDSHTSVRATWTNNVIVIDDMQTY
jgi:hypothetical protein